MISIILIHKWNIRIMWNIWNIYELFGQFCQSPLKRVPQNRLRCLLKLNVNLFIFYSKSLFFVILWQRMKLVCINSKSRERFFYKDFTIIIDLYRITVKISITVSVKMLIKVFHFKIWHLYILKFYKLI